MFLLMPNISDPFNYDETSKIISIPIYNIKHTLRLRIIYAVLLLTCHIVSDKKMKRCDEA